ncbi:tryptophan synthase subunit beta [Stutzerimonas kirkiae]|uniref:Tryptophan synthase subunit beta n=2 Tax=Stutzerimonas kirkiae TaxID=2211392 RepID=A0A4Q9RC22_9GAMM|nr:tryptophan synthase subunit beta [Stutzerimonas kirkiae]TBU97398.1 tryptophan synthase subunit beta [Stutzerimonas kirkiae]TBV00374.1 tryptophan synthase subunit beta [Stutzerimonas kirkiae]TBV05501.1 tryptophan synthase subunit beta [Stutzerimonas kirkiae]TBV10553.1 tryptophan synthase subunit beta [Stutzerimonas kirkiae]
MLYVQHDSAGNLLRVEEQPFPEMNGKMAAKTFEIQSWQQQQAIKQSLQHLRQSDLDMIRVLEDLIQVLIGKGVISITDLPEAAQAKLNSRFETRANLSELGNLIAEDEDVRLA